MHGASRVDFQLLKQADAALKQLKDRCSHLPSNAENRQLLDTIERSKQFVGNAIDNREKTTAKIQNLVHSPQPQDQKKFSQEFPLLLKSELQKHLFQQIPDAQMDDIVKVLSDEINMMAQAPGGTSKRVRKFELKHQLSGGRSEVTIPFTYKVELSEDRSQVELRIIPPGKKYTLGEGGYKKVKKSHLFTISLGNNKEVKYQRRALFRVQKNKNALIPNQPLVRWDEKSLMDYESNIEKGVRLQSRFQSLVHQGVKLVSLPKLRHYQSKSGAKRIEMDQEWYNGDLRKAFNSPLPLDFGGSSSACKLSKAEQFDILVDMGYSLGKMNDIGIVHRDIKPENILVRLDPNGQQIPEGRLTDFDLTHEVGKPTGTTGLYNYWDTASQRGLVLPSCDGWGLALSAAEALFDATTTNLLAQRAKNMNMNLPQYLSSQQRFAIQDDLVKREFSQVSYEGLSSTFGSDLAKELMQLTRSQTGNLTFEKIQQAFLRDAARLEESGNIEGANSRRRWAAAYEMKHGVWNFLVDLSQKDQELMKQLQTPMQLVGKDGMLSQPRALYEFFGDPNYLDSAMKKVYEAFPPTREIADKLAEFRAVNMGKIPSLKSLETLGQNLGYPVESVLVEGLGRRENAQGITQAVVRLNLKNNLSHNFQGAKLFADTLGGKVVEVRQGVYAVQISTQKAFSMARAKNQAPELMKALGQYRSEVGIDFVPELESLKWAITSVMALEFGRFFS